MDTTTAPPPPPGDLTKLCETVREACDILAPMVKSFYYALNGETSKLKADKSVFTIADGIVQHLLKNDLFGGGKFLEIVGEEDESNINLAEKPYTVEELVVPEQFYESIDGVTAQISELSKQISQTSFAGLTVFIDPIDGTREFATGLGEQCTFCIGFSDPAGIPCAGVVYRPIPEKPTWAAGAKSEGYFRADLDAPDEPNAKGFLTSNGSISPFIVALMAEMGFERVPSGGAGGCFVSLSPY
jgi:3'(2'), 5'-bisphosphate nucleotidase